MPSSPTSLDDGGGVQDGAGVRSGTVLRTVAVLHRWSGGQFLLETFM